MVYIPAMRSSLALVFSFACIGLAPMWVHAQTTSWASRLTGPTLERRLVSSEDASERAAAARGLGTRGDPRRATTALIEALDRERAGVVRSEIAKSLVLRGDPLAVPALVRAFDAAGDDGRPLALALGAFATPDALGVLSAALDRGDLAIAAREGLLSAGIVAAPFLVRRLRETGSVVAAEILGEIGDASAVPRLVVAAASDAIPLRRASLRALANLGDDRALPIVRASLEHEDPSVSDAAWRALAALATTDDADRLLAAAGDEARASFILPALLRVDPVRGEQAIIGYVTSDDPAKVRVAAELALALPHPRLVSVLYGIFEERTRRPEAAGALAETEGGAGLPVLLREAPEDPDARRALAVALRRWEDRIGDTSRIRGLEILRDHVTEGYAAIEGLTLRALARDVSAREPLEALLASDDPAERGWAARALTLLQEADEDLVVRAIRKEEDPEAFRRLAELSRTLGAPVSVSLALRWLNRTETAPEALRLLGSLPLTSPSRRALRAGLRADDPQTRVAAAFGLADARDATAWRALLERVEVDEALEVRRAAATALAQLAPQLARDEREVIARRADVANDEVLRMQLREPVGIARGRRILRFRVAASGVPEGVLVDVLLPTGEWMRLRTLPSGEVFVVDQPAGVADVRVRASGASE